MPHYTVPTYAIVELLIRLSEIEPCIGDYKNHTASADYVAVVTSAGQLSLSKEIIMQQFNAPEQIDRVSLIEIAEKFIKS